MGGGLWGRCLPLSLPSFPSLTSVEVQPTALHFSSAQHRRLHRLLHLHHLELHPHVTSHVPHCLSIAVVVCIPGPARVPPSPCPSTKLRHYPAALGRCPTAIPPPLPPPLLLLLLSLFPLLPLPPSLPLLPPLLMGCPLSVRLLYGPLSVVIPRCGSLTSSTASFTVRCAINV